jgi:hypothetical protein
MTTYLGDRGGRGYLAQVTQVLQRRRHHPCHQPPLATPLQAKSAHITVSINKSARCNTRLVRAAACERRAARC